MNKPEPKPTQLTESDTLKLRLAMEHAGRNEAELRHVKLMLERAEHALNQGNIARATLWDVLRKRYEIADGDDVALPSGTITRAPVRLVEEPAG